ncbi:Chymotrypsin [Operophtera brumata]|uniref:Chymotrypsin n=1 Tax=Operophtera brumata TaxID=104452 RepID=A0A0L7LAV4_OPEBR|nr:Chymotrypsin [Operophtera brumata]
METVQFLNPVPTSITMKFALTLLALVAVAQAKYLQVDLEDNTAYNYLAKYGLPLAEKIRAAEEAASQNRIVGGSIAHIEAFPHQVGIIAQFSQGQGVCGGSLISTNRVLTAAHCWFDGRNQATLFTLVLGSNTLFYGGTRVNTNHVVMHSDWIPTLIRNDVAMAYMPNHVALTNLIQPVALPSGSQLDENFTGEIANATGFGLTSDANAYNFLCFSPGGSISANQFVSSVQLPVISNTVCFMSFPFIIQSSNICINGAGGRSTCSGDSGGPLTVQRNGRPLLIGVTSFGSGSGCELGFPAAFARYGLPLAEKIRGAEEPASQNRMVGGLPSPATAFPHQNIAIPLAEEVEKAEATITQNRIIGRSQSQVGQFPYHIGITSFGAGLGCEVGMPAVFARVSSFIDFFNQA